MTSFFRRACWLLAVLPALPLHAAEPVERQSDQIEEVSVVASRVVAPIRKVPSAISVIEIEDIQLGRAQLGLDESLGRVPGVFTQNRYNFAQDLRIAVRGFGARANFGIRGLKIYADGIPATTADGQSGIDDVDIGSLQRMEIVRGPAAALYGAAAGGVIALYTEDGPDTPYVQSAVTIGEDQQRKYQLKAGGQLDRLNYLVSVSDLGYDGYRDNARVESRQFNSKFVYRLREGEVTLIANLVDSPQADDAGGITAAQAAADPTSAQARNLSSNAGEALEQQKIALRYRRPLAENLELSVRNYYVWRDFEAFLPIGTHIPFVADDGVVEFDRFFYGGGVQLAATSTLFGFDNAAIFGLDIDRQEDDRQRFLNNAGSKGALTFDQMEQATTVGVFVRNETALTDQLSLVLGLRYDDIELDVDDSFLANADQSSTLSFDQWSPMAGLSWTLNDQLTFYANYATSFETPTFTELASPARTLSVSLGGFNNVSAQEAESFEFGLKGDGFDQRLAFELAVYQINVEDEITSVEDIGNRAFFANADTDRKGVELSAVADFSESLRVSVAYTYADFEFESFDGSPQFEGNTLPGLPEHQFFAELRYQHDRGLYAVADVLYMDKLFVDNANSGTSDSAVVANLRMGYRAARDRWSWSPFIGVNNLADEDYNANVRINGFGGRLFEPAPGRNVYAGFTLDYALR
ncbi:MAG: TonB-dependent receptor family protein [bacterium]